MPVINVKTNIDQVLKALNDVGRRQVPFAASKALNQAVFKAAEATKKEMRSVFDRPTPWVLGGVRYRKSTKAKLEASVDFDFWGNKQSVTVEQVLAAEVHGGVRKRKRHEIALERVGILPRGMGIVPGAAAKLDAYGNMSAGQINQIISWFQGFGEQGYKANINDKGRKRIGRDKKKSGARGFAYFALRRPHGKLLPGVYQRFKTGFGSAVKPVMIFVPMPNYRRRLDFFGIAQRVALDEFNRTFEAELSAAIRTAR